MKLIIIIICFYSLFNTINLLYVDESNYQYVFLLPLALLLFTLFVRANIKKSLVYVIFYIQAIFRYCIIPLGIGNGEYLGNGAFSLKGDTAIIYMCIELIPIFILFSLNHEIKPIKLIHKPLNLINKNYYIYIVALIFLLIILGSGFFSKVNLIWELKDYVNDENRGDENIASIGGLLFYPFKIMILLISSSLILSLKKISKKIKILLLILLMGGASVFIIGSSRLSILTFILPFYFILKETLDKKYIRIINISLLTLLSSVIVITSLAKFSRGDKEATTDSVFNIASLNAYFAGPGNVAVGIDAFEERADQNYVQIMLNDIFQNIPLASKLTDNQYKTNYIYNYKVYGHSLWQTQIVPLSIAGLFHFNFLGVGVYACLFLYLAFYFEKRAKSEIYLPYKYIFYYLVLVLSMVFMLNIGSIIVTLFRTFVFIYLPFYISNQLQKIK